jgi:hypothetical protein
MFMDQPGDHRNIKHIATHKEFARDAQIKGITELVFVPTEEQLADEMTKALPFYPSVLPTISTTVNSLLTGPK